MRSLALFQRQLNNRHGINLVCVFLSKQSKIVYEALSSLVYRDAKWMRLDFGRKFSTRKGRRKSLRSFSRLNVPSFARSLLETKIPCDTKICGGMKLKYRPCPECFLITTLNYQKEERKQNPRSSFPLFVQNKLSSKDFFPLFSLRFIAACLYVLHNKIKEK